jgi:hypothetical protein
VLYIVGCGLIYVENFSLCKIGDHAIIWFFSELYPQVGGLHTTHTKSSFHSTPIPNSATWLSTIVVHFNLEKYPWCH